MTNKLSFEKIVKTYMKIHNNNKDLKPITFEEASELLLANKDIIAGITTQIRRDNNMLQ